jgi:uncharacterized SAM-binding protein YcdF (DUF218 family)
MNRIRRGCLTFLLSLLILAAAVWLLREPFLRALGSVLVEDDGPQKADAIVVLGGDEFGMRIVKAAQLAQAGYAPVVLVSGPSNLMGSEADATIEYARRQGYPVSLFRPIPHTADSTRSETLILGDELKREGVHKILLVTSNYHTRRAARLFRKQVSWLDIRVIAAPDKLFVPDSWWKTRGGQKQFFFEWLKTFSAWVGN